MRLLAGALLLLVAACQGGEPPPSPSPSPAAETPPEEPTPSAEQDSTLRYAISEPDAVVPADVTDGDSALVVDALFDSLTSLGPRLELQPAAAARWRANDTATEWTFVLRRGATFHDGSPVTAADFAFAWNLAVREGDAGYHLAVVDGYDDVVSGETDSLEGLQTDGDHVLRVTLREPLADFPAVAAHPALGPVPAGAWREDPGAFRQRPVGNGPFAMAEDWARGRFIRLARFADWQNGPMPDVSEVLFQIFDQDSAYLAFQQGRLDVTSLPTGALQDALDRYGPSPDPYGGPGVVTGDVPVLYYLGFDVEQAPFDDLEVRRALSWALDTERIAEQTLEGNVAVARAAVPPAVRDARSRACLTCVYDPDRAEAVFAERGIDQLVLWFNRDGGHEEVALRVREDLAEVGVRVIFRSEEFPEYLDALEHGDAALFRFGWALEYPTMDDALYPLFHSRSIPPGPGHNYGRYRSAEVDELLDEARRTTEDEARRRMYQRAESVILRDQAIVPVMTYRHRLVVSERLEGFHMNAMGLANLAEASVRATEP